jgi:hypothetical protein
MASKILKGLAVAAGTGLAIGLGRKRRTQATPIGAAPDNTPAMEPPLDRLGHIEARVSAVEARPVPNFEALLESLLVPHVEDLGARLRTEMRESMEAGLTNFERMLDDKVSLRIAPIEKAVTDQSATIASLSQRAIEAEENFQRLISAVERLCERKEQPVLDLPSAFRPRIVKEDDARLRHRNPLATL